MRILLCTLAMCVVGLLAKPAYGCTCVSFDNPEEHSVTVQERLRHYYLTEFHGALFTGTVISVSAENYEMVVSDIVKKALEYHQKNPPINYAGQSNKGT